MATNNHFRMLERDGVEVWNMRRRREPFIPDLQKARLMDFDLRGVDLRNADLQGADLRRSDLREAILLGADFRGARLDGVRLQGVDLRATILLEAVMTAANFEKSNLSGVDLSRTNLRSANFEEANLRRSKLIKAHLEGADFQSARMQEANLRSAALQNSNLNLAYLAGADLQRTNLVGAILHGADLRNTNLRNANLSECNLQGNDMRGANLMGAQLQNTNLNSADMGHVSLIGSYVRGADFKSAQLDMADVRSTSDILGQKGVVKTDLTHARNLTQELLNTMLGDTGVIVPAHLNHPEHWPIWNEEESTPKKIQIESTLRATIRTSYITTTVNDGRIELIDGPPGGEPELVDPQYRASLFLGVLRGSELFIEKFNSRKPNLPADILHAFDKTRALGVIKSEHWHEWEHPLASIEDDLDQYVNSDWRGTRKIAEKVVEQIRELKLFLKLALPKSDAAGNKNIVEIEDYSTEASRNIEATIRELESVKNAQQIFAPNVLSYANRAARELSRIETAVELTTDEGQKEKKISRWKTVVLGIAGFAASIGLIFKDTVPGVLSNLLTNKEALTTLKTWWEAAWNAISNLLKVVGAG